MQFYCAKQQNKYLVFMHFSNNKKNLRDAMHHGG